MKHLSELLHYSVSIDKEELSSQQTGCHPLASLPSDLNSTFCVHCTASVQCSALLTLSHSQTPAAAASRKIFYVHRKNIPVHNSFTMSV